jgi:hypothetical protein
MNMLRYTDGKIKFERGCENGWKNTGKRGTRMKFIDLGPASL